MGAPPHPSFWLESTPETDYSSLDSDISVDVAVIGAGTTGLTATTLLKRAGKTVAVLEAKQVIQRPTVAPLKRIGDDE